MLWGTNSIRASNRKTYAKKCIQVSASKRGAGGKPSTWLPPGRLVKALFEKRLWIEGTLGNQKTQQNIENSKTKVICFLNVD